MLTPIELFQTVFAVASAIATMFGLFVASVLLCCFLYERYFE